MKNMIEKKSCRLEHLMLPCSLAWCRAGRSGRQGRAKRKRWWPLFLVQKNTQVKNSAGMLCRYCTFIEKGIFTWSMLSSSSCLVAFPVVFIPGGLAGQFLVIFYYSYEMCRFLRQSKKRHSREEQRSWWRVLRINHMRSDWGSWGGLGWRKGGSGKILSLSASPWKVVGTGGNEPRPSGN